MPDITSASSPARRGIGRAIARRLAADGFAVAVNYANNQAMADGSWPKSRRRRRFGIAVRGERGQRGGHGQAVRSHQGRLQRIDVVVSSAGTMPYLKIADGDLEASTG